ncbi:MGH1-like glycoside hydrolase domain-containing protein [Gracilibacillus sp. D59]|uniref:MGH1-like glycoside hydrolase domain-containing protein n=1 Tax=Gracilibacillus sp. D59 TaxID=3457434 RepID=UPI003FCE2117
MSKNYETLKKSLAQGWNTWNTRSVLSHVLLPEGFAINIGIKEYSDGNYLKESLIGRLEKGAEQVIPGAHAYDGSYTCVHVEWKGIEIKVETAQLDDDLVLLVTPQTRMEKKSTLIIESGILWNRDGAVSRTEEGFIWSSSKKEVNGYGIGQQVEEINVQTQAPYIALTLDSIVGFSTGTERSIADIQQIVKEQKLKHEERKAFYGDLKEVYDSLQTCMAWDTIYDPSHDRVVTPVSRIWNCTHGGYALFCWDNYFAAYMASLDNKALAYANAIEITKERTEAGFVPNCSWGNGFKSHDRSQPPVGSLIVRELYRKFSDKWLLEEVVDDLLAWNNWFYENRMNGDLLAWGSTPYEPEFDNYWETAGVNDTFGGALESGLDNSPMYDDVPFNKKNHMMELHDVGLNSIYIMDCLMLADICEIVGQKQDKEMLMGRAAIIKENMKDLWSEQDGFYYNKLIDSGEFSKRISPTNFYPLLGNVATQEQAQRMMNEHFYNEQEFYGEWILPSISRNDKAYPEQEYWRGRIWAPMNFLVYLGLRNYDLPDAREDLVNKSRDLLMKEWTEHGHIHENYNADTGEGCDKQTSDRYYHWGALLGFISLIEEGYIKGWEGQRD